MGEKPSVAVLGAGVSGLTVAHELTERGFLVDVYEKRGIAGGKARSFKVQQSESETDVTLPGQHGLHFFIRFYKNVFDTMKRIPLPGGGSTYDNLVQARRVEHAVADGESYSLSLRFPRNLSDLTSIIEGMKTWKDNVAPGEFTFFFRKVWNLLSSCRERWYTEYDNISWWDFIEADAHSQAYRRIMGHGFSKGLTGAPPKEVSARIMGKLVGYWIQDTVVPGKSSELLLNGPLNEKWIDPWTRYLEECGVTIHYDSPIEEIQCGGGRVQSLQLASGEEVEADIYVSALPVEVLSPLITPHMEQLDPALEDIHALAESVSWYAGVELYLDTHIPAVSGHKLFGDSKWALITSQTSDFWNPGMDAHGPEEVEAVLSVVVADWDVPGHNGKPAKNCGPEELVEEILRQINYTLGEGTLLKDHLHSWSIGDKSETAHSGKSGEPLFVNRTGAWKLRPHPETHIQNFFLAGDFLKTSTDFTSMESANESARRCVNAIIEACEVSLPRCSVWKHAQWKVLRPWQWRDKKKCGQEHYSIPSEDVL